MKNGRLISIPATVLLMFAAGACDKPDDGAKARPDAKPEAEAKVKVDGDADAEAKFEAAAMVEADAEAQEAVAIAAALDLEAIVGRIEEGKIESAADLEASLASDETLAKIDIDEDGKTDRLHVVEKRTETAASFEIRAVAAGEIEADADADADADAKVEVEAAPLLATLELAAKADVGTVEARASYSAEFAAKASLDMEATAVTRTFSGVKVNAEGSMEVEASANVFVSWAFETERPVYVAEVFVEEKEKAQRAAKDPCWPPGHCKHDLWKARGELPPGQQAKVDEDAPADDRGRGADKAADKAKGKGKAHDDASPGKSHEHKPDKADKSSANPGGSPPDKKDTGKPKDNPKDDDNGRGNDKAKGPPDKDKGPDKDKAKGPDKGNGNPGKGKGK